MYSSQSLNSVGDMRRYRGRGGVAPGTSDIAWWASGMTASLERSTPSRSSLNTSAYSVKSDSILAGETIPISFATSGVTGGGGGISVPAPGPDFPPCASLCVPPSAFAAALWVLGPGPPSWSARGSALEDSGPESRAEVPVVSVRRAARQVSFPGLFSLGPAARCFRLFFPAGSGSAISISTAGTAVGTTLCALHSAPCALCSALCVLRSALCTLRPALCALRPAPGAPCSELFRGPVPSGPTVPVSSVPSRTRVSFSANVIPSRTRFRGPVPSGPTVPLPSRSGFPFPSGVPSVPVPSRSRTTIMKKSWCLSSARLACLYVISRNSVLSSSGLMGCAVATTLTEPMGYANTVLLMGGRIFNRGLSPMFICVRFSFCHFLPRTRSTPSIIAGTTKAFMVAEYRPRVMGKVTTPSMSTFFFPAPITPGVAVCFIGMLMWSTTSRVTKFAVAPVSTRVAVFILPHCEAKIMSGMSTLMVHMACVSRSSGSWPTSAGSQGASQ